MQKHKGFSLIELLVVVAILLVIMAMAIPSMLRARIAANEASAVNAVRSITTAQISYIISYPDSGYGATLDNLGPGPGLPDPTHAGLLPASLGSAPYQHSGYQFTSTGTKLGFTAAAVPLTPGTSGVRSFCTDTPAAIYYSPTESGCVTGTNPL